MTLFENKKIDNFKEFFHTFIFGKLHFAKDETNSMRKIFFFNVGPSKSNIIKRMALFESKKISKSRKVLALWCRLVRLYAAQFACHHAVKAEKWSNGLRTLYSCLLVSRFSISMLCNEFLLAARK